jgi:hypothetical protein
MARGISFTGEHLTRFLAGQKRWQEARDRRVKETEAGRASTFADFCRSHGLCPDCAGSGVTLRGNGVGFKAAGLNGNLPLYEECAICSGSGRIVAPS